MASVGPRGLGFGGREGLVGGREIDGGEMGEGRERGIGEGKG